MSIILDMDSVVHEPGVFGEEKACVGTVELIEGKLNGACRFSFAAESRGGFFTAPIAATPEWDEAAGISFWLKGDGSPMWGGMQFVDTRDPKLRYAFEFPLDSTAWRKIEVRWRDLLPVTPHAPFLDPRNGYRPSRLGFLNFGQSAWWFEWPAHSFAIDHVRLAHEIAAEPPTPPPAVAGLSRVRAKLAARRPIIMVTMGDSLTSRYHWANKELCWVDLVAQQLRVHAHSEVAVVNPAMGGHQLTHGLLQMGRWLPRCPSPDLVTVWFGGNDWSEGMRQERFEEVLRSTVDRVRRMTKGSADILLMATVPWLQEWDGGIRELGDAVRLVAAEKATGFCDTYGAFQRAGAQPESRTALYAWDEVHLGPHGHEVVAAAVVEALLGS